MIPYSVRQRAIDAVQDTIQWTGYMNHEDIIDVALPAAFAALFESEEALKEGFNAVVCHCPAPYDECTHDDPTPLVKDVLAAIAKLVQK